jgi:hypothetical protein
MPPRSPGWHKGFLADPIKLPLTTTADWAPADVSALVPAGVFFDQAVDVSTPNAQSWEEVDVSGMPGCSEAIGAYVEHLSPTTTYGWGIRAKGSTDARVSALADPRHGWALIGVENGVFEQFVEGLDVSLWVVGCHLANAVFHTDAIDRSLTDPYEYTALNTVPGAIGTIFEVANTGDSHGVYGLRAPGSAVELEGTARVDGHLWAVSGVDQDGFAEGRISNVAVDFWEVGYFLSTETSLAR